MITQCRNINTCLTNDGQEIFFIGKFYLSTVNYHMAHSVSSLLCFHIYCIKVTVVLTCTAFDTDVVINVFDFT